jgi:hypothetical protein
MQARKKMQEPKEASRYHQEEFSFKGGSHLVSQTHFLSSLSKSRDEISLKGGSLSHPKTWECENKIK